MAKLVEKIYGDALFELSVEKNQIDILYEEARFVKDIIKNNSDLIQLLNHPKVSKDEKEKVVENIFKNRLTDDMTGFLVLIVKKSRQKDIKMILDYFIGRVKEYKKIGVATVKTAYVMNESQKESIESKLISTTEYKSFEIQYVVDESLIGGMIIRVGDRVIDSSIKNKIEKMSKELYKVRLVN